MKKKASKVNMVEMGQVKPEPAWQGEPFVVRKGLEVKQPANCKMPRDLWEAKMRSKYLDYHEKIKKSLLTGAAKNRVKEQL